MLGKRAKVVALIGRVGKPVGWSLKGRTVVRVEGVLIQDSYECIIPLGRVSVHEKKEFVK